MTDLRQAAQQALEALEHHSAIKHPQQIHYRDTAIAALKAALEQQAEPPPEWPLIKNIIDEYGLDAIAFVAEWKAAQQQAEPVADEAIHAAWSAGYVEGEKAALEQQQAEPTCPDCKAAVLYECVACSSNNYPPKQQAEPVAMRMPKVGDKVICLEDESLGTVVSLTAGGSPDITFDDGSRGTYLLREFAELFGYFTAPPEQQAEPPPEWPLIKNILAVFGLDAIAFVAEWKAAQRKELSASEILNMMPSAIPAEYDGPLMEFARAIEAKIKERNT